MTCLTTLRPGYFVPGDDCTWTELKIDNSNRSPRITAQGPFAQRPMA